ncbi:hypothetical protein acdb102_23160 [Acidothermaceae bacterium B102]|nr:hypothetical protein acdb102_23160 [Acidothermaceae bacterium B102]
MLTATRSVGLSASPRARQLASVVTEIFAPAVCGVVGLIAVAVHNTGSGAGAAWGGLAAIFVCGLPMAYVIRGVKDGRWDDHHVADREKRTLPLLVALISVIVGALVLLVVHAPRELVALVCTTVPELVIAIGISRWWKISIHAAVVAGLLGVLMVLYGPWMLLALPLVVLVGWARRVLRARTWPQVVVGATIGWGVALVAFSLLRLHRLFAARANALQACHAGWRTTSLTRPPANPVGRYGCLTGPLTSVELPIVCHLPPPPRCWRVVSVALAVVWRESQAMTESSRHPG